jgi:cell division septation protein DedD
MAVRWTQLDPLTLDITDPDSLPPGPGAGEVVIVAFSPAAVEAGLARKGITDLVRGWSGGDRRLLLVDLEMEGPGLHTELDEPLGQGISDVILFGASIPSVARQPAGEGFLFVTAGVPVAHPDEVLGSDRWGPILRAFREAGVTLVLAAPLEGPDLQGIAALADLGVLLTGEGDDAEALLAPLPGKLGDSVGETESASEWVAVSGVADGAAMEGAWVPPEKASETVGEEEEDRDAVKSGFERSRARDRGTPDILGAEAAWRSLPQWATWVGAVVIAVVGFWGLSAMGIVPLPFGSDDSGREPAFVEGSPSGSQAAPEEGSGDQLDPGAVEGGTETAAGTGDPPSEAPGQADASPTVRGGAEAPLNYSLGMASYENESDAVALVTDLRNRVSDVLFITAPVEVNGQIYWRVLAGPAIGTDGAEELRRTLPPRLGYGSGSSWVVHWTPMAFLLAESPSAPAARTEAETFRGQGLPAYVLPGRDSDGSPVWRVYTGAYSSSEQAAILAQRLREVIGALPPLVRRTGLPPR